MVKLTRRAALGTIGAATAMAAMPAFAAERRIRHFWWGNPERDRRTFEVIDLYKAHHPGIEVSGETIGWGDYWTKMATQTAGGNMADLVQMDYRFLFEYVRRGALQSLDEHIGNGLDLSNLDAGPVEGGMVDGKLYALNIGSNTQVMPYNIRLLDEAGVDADVINWTREEFGAACEQITSKTGARGSDDYSLTTENMEAWIRQEGYEFYDAEGNVAAKAEDVAAFWQFWADLRDAGIVADKNKTVMVDASMSDWGIVTGDSAISSCWSNQLVAVQSLTQDTIGAAMLPHKAGGVFGQYIKPSQFLALTRDSTDVEAAVAYMNDWVNDPEATAVLGLERGIPASSVVREALAPNLNEAEKLSVEFFAAVQDKVSPLPLPAPKGAGEVRDAFARTGTEVVLGSMDIMEAAERFVDDAQSIVDRAR